MKKYQKILEQIDLLSIEHKFLFALTFDNDFSSKDSFQTILDDYKNNLILSYDEHKLSFKEQLKNYALHCESSIINIEQICDKILLTNKHLKTNHQLYKKMDLIELKKDQLVEKLLLKIYDIRFGDKYCTFYRNKKEVVFFIIESAFIKKIDHDGIIHILISGPKFLKGRNELGKTLGISSLPEGYR